MPHVIRPAALVAGTALVLIAATAAARPFDHVEVRFGNHRAGSPFPPGSGHDRSFHGADKIIPGTVILAEGGRVTFHLAPIHQVAIYRPGVEPGDIRLEPETLDDLSVPCVPVPLRDFVIDDEEGRIALSPAQVCAPTHWTTPSGTFDRPGRYLMICTTTPHFTEARMYGWILVK